MSSESYVMLALNKLKCTQKELALKLGVSPTQITKWKKGEYLSHEARKKLSEIAGVANRNPDFILLVGGIEQADKWARLISYLADVAYMNDETGFITQPLVGEDSELLCWHTMDTLREAGVEIPKQFPSELDIEYDNDTNSEIDDEIIWNLLDHNPYSSLISKMFKALTDLYGFYAAYIDELIEHDEFDFPSTHIDDVRCCLIELSLAKVGEQNEVMTNFLEFRRKTVEQYGEWIAELKVRAIKHRIPLRAELMDLVEEDHDYLGHLAEREALGFNRDMAHPDIYMNEILVSQRTIHKVLAAICKKLGVTEKELALRL